MAPAPHQPALPAYGFIHNLFDPAIRNRQSLTPSRPPLALAERVGQRPAWMWGGVRGHSISAERQWPETSAQTSDVKGTESRVDTRQVLSLHLLGHDVTAVALASQTIASVVHG